jgi:hypothetical protein
MFTYFKPLVYKSPSKLIKAYGYSHVTLKQIAKSHSTNIAETPFSFSDKAIYYWGYSKFRMLAF